MASQALDDQHSFSLGALDSDSFGSEGYRDLGEMLRNFHENQEKKQMKVTGKHFTKGTNSVDVKKQKIQIKNKQHLETLATIVNKSLKQEPLISV